jgi:hypothetical protein
MRTSFLLAASIAGIFALVGIERSAVAQMQPMSPMAESKAPKAAPKKKPAGRGFLPRKGGKGPGQCGTYMYWKGGKCVDARTGKK